MNIEYSWTPLQDAAAEGNLQKIMTLISANPSIVDDSGYHEVSALRL